MNTQFSHTVQFDWILTILQLLCVGFPVLPISCATSIEAFTAFALLQAAALFFVYQFLTFYNKIILFEPCSLCFVLRSLRNCHGFIVLLDIIL